MEHKAVAPSQGLAWGPWLSPDIKGALQVCLYQAVWVLAVLWSGSQCLPQAHCELYCKQGRVASGSLICFLTIWLYLPISACGWQYRVKVLNSV